jgi:hypothetical protein
MRAAKDSRNISNCEMAKHHIPDLSNQNYLVQSSVVQERLAGLLQPQHLLGSQ